MSQKPAQAPPRREGLRSYINSFGLAILLALVCRQFIIQAFRIPSSSMEDTLLIGDFLFVNKFLYGAKLPYMDARLPKVRDPKRGDIIVFISPVDGRDFIKRCVAVAGDTVEVRAKDLYINGVQQIEPYVKHEPGLRPMGVDRRDYFGPVVVPPGDLFMMGDNRDNSSDSRYWGPLPKRLVKGKALFIYFSVDTQKGLLPPHIRWRRFGRIIH
jgi:signal peptidase I